MKNLVALVVYMLLSGNSIGECDSTLLTSKISQGENVVSRTYSYVAHINYKDDHLCGAVLISVSHALTAAGYVYMISRNLYPQCSIKLGSVDIISGTRHYIDEIMIPEEFNTFGTIFLADIAVIRLNASVDLSQHIRTVDLHTEFVGANVNATVIGWGSIGHPPYVQYRSQFSPRLKKLGVTTLGNDECKERLGFSFDDSLLCAISPLGGHHNIAHGDEGDPLVNQDGQLIGIASSYSYHRTIPSIYTRISTYHNFITAAMAEPCQEEIEIPQPDSEEIVSSPERCILEIDLEDENSNWEYKR